MPLKREDDVIKAVTDLRMYIFESQPIADTFGFLVTRYFEKTVDSKGLEVLEGVQGGYPESY